MLTTNAIARAGWTVRDYAQACAFSKATYYNIPQELRPRSVLIGRRRVVIEPPAEYLERLAAAQAEAVK